MNKIEMVRVVGPVSQFLSTISEEERQQFDLLLEQINKRQSGSAAERQKFLHFVDGLIAFKCLQREAGSIPEALSGRLNPCCVGMTERIALFLGGDLLTMALGRGRTREATAFLNAILLIAYDMYLRFPLKVHARSYETV